MTANPKLPAPFVELARNLATTLQVDRDALVRCLADTVYSKGSAADVQAFLIVANQYELNPLTNEIYAFPKKGGGLQPLVGVDGWLTLANRQPQFDGMSFEYEDDADGNPVSCTCTVWRKDRAHPISAPEYYAECARKTDPWRDMPRRMLRHRAMAQALRMSFGFSGLMEPDEAAQWREREEAREAEARPQPGGRRDTADLRARGRQVREEGRTIDAQASRPAPDDLDEDNPFDTERYPAPPTDGVLWPEESETRDPEANA